MSALTDASPIETETNGDESGPEDGRAPLKGIG